MQKTALLGIAAAAMLAAAPAFAADLAPIAPMYKAPAMIVPPASWTGFYIGGDIGGSWSHTNGSWTGLPSAAAFGVNPTGGSLDGSSFLGGVHAGYDYQFAPAWVFGVEGDWTWTHDRGSNSQAWTLFGTGTPVGGGAATTMNSTVDWLASFRGRLGYLVTPNVLAYATGGIAWGDVHYSGTAPAPTAGYLASTSFNNTSDGFVVGGGVEWALTHSWSLRGEYLFYHLNSAAGATATSAAFPAFPSSFSWSRTNVDVARVGLSYKF
jgi:outer membrane immunogenic protein